MAPIFLEAISARDKIRDNPVPKRKLTPTS